MDIVLNIGRGLLGLAFFIGVGYLISGHKKNINWRLVGIGVALQLAFGIIILKIPGIDEAFLFVSRAFVKFLSFSKDGAAFVVGDLSDNSKHSLGFIFAFEVLPTIIFFSTVSAALYYLGVLQKIVYGIAWVMAKTMGLSGAESLSAAGNIFLGQTEAPLLVRPFVKTMTRSELMCLMTGGMATIAGGVLALYVEFLGGADITMTAAEMNSEKAKMAAQLLTASVMNAPAAILMAKMIIPEMEGDKIDRSLVVNKEQIGNNLIDAMANGAASGLKLAANVAAMLLAFVGVIFLLNYLLSKVGMIGGINDIIKSSTDGTFVTLSFEYILGQVCRPVAWMMGVDWKDTLQFGSLLGVKTAVNELIAYLQLAEIKTAQSMSPKSIYMATFALCGFANFSSIAIQIGGIGGMAPERQGDLAKLGFKALLGAAIACMMTGTVAGMLF